jgi:Domain of Unknown Function (DUF1080)
MKTNFFILFLVVTLLCQCLYGQKEGWEPLFKGNDLSQWQVCASPKDVAKQYWKVENSVIVVNTNGDTDHDYVWLATMKEYKDFELKLQFAAFKSSKGNSGIQIHSRYDKDTLWMDGPQIDINPPEPYRIGLMWDETRGINRWIFPDLPKGEWVKEEMVIGKPEFYYSDDSLHWNRMEIKVEGLHVRAWLNGILITDFKGEGILNDQIHRTLGIVDKGVIALQIHRGDDLKILYREIYVRKL